jgi:GntR family transcriptional regulator
LTDSTGNTGVVPAVRPHRVSRANRLPLYHQIETDMRARIERDEWQPGEQIPTESQLCIIYGTSRITVRQAVSNLVSEGLLTREPGRGTFVREPAVTAGARGLTSFTQEMLALGLRAGSSVIDIHLEPAGEETTERLRLEPDAPVVCIKRLRLGSDIPIGVQVARLPAARFPGLDRADLSDRSLYGYISEYYGVTPTEAEETFWVIPAAREDAALLHVKAGACCFKVERTTYDESGPFEFVTSVMRGDRYRIRLGLRALS